MLNDSEALNVNISLSCGDFILGASSGGLVWIKVKLLPDGPLPSSRLYNLSRPEREAMKIHIWDSLKAGLICPSSSTVGAGFFYVEKKDETLLPCFD